MGRDDVTLLYRVIRYIFRCIASVFYATTEVHGLDQFPPKGVPTILCFNHGNGLADPLVLIRKTPRMVRFCAKDSLWRTPVMNVFIRNSGAVPVYRSKDHGDKAKDLNLDVFARVISALRNGGCLGFAPEGVSRFLPYMEQPLKTGVARIALDAVQQAAAAGEKGFCVHLAPVGLTFTHREKFRSDLCMRYCDPIKVDAASLDAHGGDVRAAAAAITAQLNEVMLSVTINAPEWDTIRLAMSAARLHVPRGTDLTLGQYLTLVRGWVEVLKATGAPAVAALRDALGAYQSELDRYGIKCERVRRASLVGQALPWYWCVWGVWQRAIACAALLAVAAPGLLLWLPVWTYVQRKERGLLAKGPRWNDSVAEMKMMICGLIGIVAVVGCTSAAVLRGSLYPFLPLPYMYFTMRCYEEAVSLRPPSCQLCLAITVRSPAHCSSPYHVGQVADARSAYSLYKLLLLSPADMKGIVVLRTAAKTAMDGTTALLPAGVAEHVALAADDARPTLGIDYYFPWWLARLVLLVARRRKKDWNEVLRLRDVATMDYAH